MDPDVYDVLVRWIFAAGVFVLTFTALFALKWILLRRWTKNAKSETATFLQMCVHSLSLPLTLVILGVAIMTGHRLSGLPDNLGTVAEALMTLLAVIALFLFLDRICVNVVRKYGRKFSPISQVEGVLKIAIHGSLIALAVLILLDSYGISITPFIASLGIGSLAVALALQDTLSNFFSGLHIVADKQIHRGDLIRMETGQEGFIQKMGWRSTQVRLLNETILVVPNSKLANSIILNYDLPGHEIGIGVEVSVSYESNLEKVEKLTAAVAGEVIKSFSKQIKSKNMKEYEPIVRFQAFGDLGVKYLVALKVPSYTDQFLLRHEFIKRLHKQFQKEDVDFAYTFQLRPDKARLSSAKPQLAKRSTNAS